MPLLTFDITRPSDPDPIRFELRFGRDDRTPTEGDSETFTCLAEIPAEIAAAVLRVTRVSGPLRQGEAAEFLYGCCEPESEHRLRLLLAAKDHRQVPAAELTRVCLGVLEAYGRRPFGESSASSSPPEATTGQPSPTDSDETAPTGAP